MSATDLVLYSGPASTSLHKQVDCPQCLRVLIPHLDSYRRAGRSSPKVAAVNFSNGVVVKFGCQDGRIEIKEERPMFGTSRRMLGFIPVPAVTTAHTDSSDFSIHQIVSRAYTKARA